MKALVLAETIDGQRALCAGARSIADEVVLAVVKGAPETGIADKAYDIELPAGEPVENAAAGVIAGLQCREPRCCARRAHSARQDPRWSARCKPGRFGHLRCHRYRWRCCHQHVLRWLGGEQAAGRNGAKIYTIAATCFDDAEPTGTDTVETIAYTAPEKPLVLRGTKEVPRTGADLTKVDVVVGAGRGFAEEDELQIARDLCEKVGGELGCSRPLAENVNWLPKNLYIGVSGLQLAPKAYIALGISGQMQHMVGVTGADTIIAVNKDANAPIFKQADYGIVGDIKTVVPALIEKL